MDRDIQIFREGFKQGVEMFAIWRDGVQHVGAMGTPIREVYKQIDLGKYDFAFTDRDFAMDSAHLEHCTPDEPCFNCTHVGLIPKGELDKK